MQNFSIIFNKGMNRDRNYRLQHGNLASVYNACHLLDVKSKIVKTQMN